MLIAASCRFCRSWVLYLQNDILKKRNTWIYIIPLKFMSRKNKAE